MAHEEKPTNPIEERAVRIERLNAMLGEGVEPYPTTAQRSHEIAAVLDRFESLESDGTEVTVCGRLRAVRGHGGACFADLEDGSGKIQLHLKSDVIPTAEYEFFQKMVDHGDFLQITGACFVTKRGEKSIGVTTVRLLAKALRPLPAKWHGLADTEVRYRKRYLDLLANPEVRETFAKRSRLVRALREFFHKLGFMEVETPILQTLAGGATARPFTTHHNALDIELSLRIAPELFLKRLIVGGYDRVFEVGRSFRNEGIDHSHNPEFTTIEFYQAYANYEDLMTLSEELMPYLAHEVNGRPTVEFDGMEIDFTGPYRRITFRDALKEYAQLDVEAYEDRAALAKAAQERGVDVATSNDRGAILDNLYKKFVRSAIVEPTFLIDHPVEILPLAKRKPSDPRYVESFQIILGKGVELCKAFTELNDPIDQRQRFEEQEKLLAGGDDEAQRMDTDFIEALETGMPPTAGFGMGIDRLAAVLTGSHSLKEVILFPTMRPEHGGTESPENGN